ncbi:hypothetical protein NIES4071_103790 (plasmid) [Calothrix sp. NIES-4071]|nr:hypothetical protein NIES4071_103790 [Calothrix sp. NIES-4071]BAZ64366.1 hypothetical protein NIES4105_100990 [Calothrix sp. NIES-4105]
MQVNQKVWYKVNPPYYKLSAEEAYYCAAIVKQVNKKTVDIEYKDVIDGSGKFKTFEIRAKKKSIEINQPSHYCVEVKDGYEVNII